LCKSEVLLAICTITFSTDFLKGIERFQALGIKRIAPGTVLYNGEQQFNVRDIRIFNPLQIEDIWKSLTASQEQKKR